jgi:PilZ domain
VGARAVDEFSDEPQIRDRVTLETRVGPRTLVNKATIANVAIEEVWVAVGRPAAEHLVVGAAVRIILNRSEDRSLAADSSVRRLVGGSGRVVALSRPEAWVSYSRRANGRVALAIPAYLRPDTDGTVASARTTNISVGGFHCITDLPISVGHQLAVSLMLTPTSALECRAQVVRLSDDPDDPSRRRLVAAFRFVDLTAADEARVAEALAALGDETDATAVPVAWHSGEGHGRLAG